MDKDFTLSVYNDLCISLLKNNFRTVKVVDYLEKKISGPKKYAIMRHDVDRLPLQALKMAKIEHSLGIQSTYYFRSIKSVFKKELITSIYDLGHEIGYHYEVLAKNNGNKEKAIEEFKKTLENFRNIVDIKTICMHGSPLSSWRDSDLWQDLNYNDYDIMGEAFLSIDYNSVMYFTDTGRKWKNDSSNIRDTVISNIVPLNVTSTKDLILKLPKIKTDISINTHPHRWHESFLGWQWEFISQNIKNFGKYLISK
tara:strand:+ start:2265 stop:3026 length:762 start_codon:yes stop_codon:yes gene_type:complete